MKTFATLSALLVGASLISASAVPTPAPQLEQRQFDGLGDLSQLASLATQPGYISSVSEYLASQISAAISAAPQLSASLLEAESQAFSYLSEASVLLTMTDKQAASKSASAILESVTGSGTTAKPTASTTQTSSSSSGNAAPVAFGSFDSGLSLAMGLAAVAGAAFVLV